MGLRDQFTGALGGALGWGVGLLTESMAKANGIPESQRKEREEAHTAMSLSKPTGVPPEPTDQEPKGLLYDPFALIDQLGYRDRPTGLTYQTLREMAIRVPTYLGILQTRSTQVASFGQVQTDDREPGFEIKLRDDKGTPDREDVSRMIKISDWLLQTGSTWGPGRDDFKTFLRKTVRDSLILDQLNFEVVRNRKGVPAEFYAMDAATIRLADVPPGTDHDQDPETVKYVQIYDEVVIGEFGVWDLCFGIRNPRSDIRCNGYGFSELEMLINVITASLWTFEYNKRFFAQGTAAQGIINFKGSVPDSKLDDFRRMWTMMISGVHNAHRTPMTNVDDVQWIDLHTDNAKMGYADWMDWLIKITCAVCQFDPAEINFAYGNSGQTNQMYATPVETKLKHSKDRGLRPLLADIAQWINVHLIWPLDPRYKIVFSGLDTKNAVDVAELGKKQVTYLKTVDELRAEDDLDPLPNGEGEIILDPTFLQNKQAKEMAGQMGAPGEEEGDQEQDFAGLLTSMSGGGEEADAVKSVVLRAPDGRLGTMEEFAKEYAAQIRKAAHKERIPGGKASGKKPSAFDRKRLTEGTKHEMEHTSDRKVAQEIAMDHLTEDPDYYTKLQQVEKSQQIIEIEL